MTAFVEDTSRGNAGAPQVILPATGAYLNGSHPCVMVLHQLRDAYVFGQAVALWLLLCLRSLCHIYHNPEIHSNSWHCSGDILSFV